MPQQIIKSETGALKYGDDLRDITFHCYPGGHLALKEVHADMIQKIDDFLSRQLIGRNE